MWLRASMVLTLNLKGVALMVPGIFRDEHQIDHRALSRRARRVLSEPLIAVLLPSSCIQHPVDRTENKLANMAAKLMHDARDGLQPL